MSTENEDLYTLPKRVFVISPIGGAGTPERVRADRFLKYIVRVALPSPMYEVERADEHDSPLAITAAMLSSIVASDICVADITGRNPNVFYELALAHAMDKHVVIMDGDKERSPFDIQDQRAIKYGLMPDEIEAAVAQLEAKATNANGATLFKDMMNPVATAFRTWTTQQRVETSGDTTEQMLLRVVEQLGEKVDRVTRRFELEESLPDIPTVDELSDLLSRTKRGLEKVEDGVFGGSLHPSLSWLVEQGQSAVKSAEATGSTIGLRRLLVDIDYVMRRSRYGEQVERQNLPSHRSRAK